MKGFIHLIEVAVAAILITIVIGTFFSVQSVKGDWEHSDLLALGNSMGFAAEAADNASVLLSRFDRSIEINKTKPENIGYSLYIEGAPKETINVGCPGSCVKAREYLSARNTPGSFYLNRRWVSFNVTDMSMSDDLEGYDVLLLINFNGYTTYKDKLINFTNRGKVVVAVENTPVSNDFNDIFGLSSASQITDTTVNFTEYNPSEDKVAKYFLGMGFDIDVLGSGPRYGMWTIEEVDKSIKATSSQVVINEGEVDEVTVSEGQTFTMSGQSFKLKKIFYTTEPNEGIIIIQPTQASFEFNNFCEGNVQTSGKEIVSNSRPAMTANGTAIWLSEFTESDEYKTLIKSAIAANVNKWLSRSYLEGRERAAASYYTSLCCDMPEPTEFNFILWYVY